MSDRQSEIERAIFRLLDGDTADPLLKDLSPDDRAMLDEALAAIRSDPAVADRYAYDLWRIDYERRPPTMEEFVCDPYWLGKTTIRSEESEGLFPEWKRILTQDFDLESRVHNVVVTGSLGIGKSWVSVILLLYRITLARLLRNPQSFFGLSRGSAIYYSALSVSRDVVKDTVFGDFLNFMANSPFFVEVCRFDPDRKYASLQINLGNGINMRAGSQGWHVIGRNVMGVLLDEGNFRLDANPDLKAYVLYNEVRTRIKNRFERLAGFIPSISVLASSARDQSSVTQRIIDEIDASKDKDQKVYRYPVYKIKDGILKDVNSKPWFKVAYGLKTVEPTVLNGRYDKDGNPIGTALHEEAPPGSKVELVPERYSDEFARSVRTSLQNIAGVSTGGAFRFLSSMVDYHRAVQVGKESGLANPCQVPSISLSEEDSRDAWDFLDHSAMLTRQASVVMPKRDRAAKRYVHIDLATRNQAGLSMCHAVDKKIVKGVFQADGSIVDECRLVLEYDLVLSIIAGQNKPISFQKILRLLVWLREVCHFPIALVTADQFQSVFPLQVLEKANFKVANLSVDKTRRPYDTWRSALEEGRLHLFDHPVMAREAEELVDLPDKIDHEPDKTKDVMDTVVGSAYSAFTFDDKEVTRSASGLEPGVYTGLSEGDEPPPPVEAFDPERYRPPARKFDA